jgi:hypothetical protein
MRAVSRNYSKSELLYSHLYSLNSFRLKNLSLKRRLFNIFWDRKSLQLISLAIDRNQSKNQKIIKSLLKRLKEANSDLWGKLGSFLIYFSYTYIKKINCFLLSLFKSRVYKFTQNNIIYLYTKYQIKTRWISAGKKFPGWNHIK